MKTPTRLIQTVTLLGLLLYGLNSVACTTDAWIGGVAGSPLPGSPTPEGISRVSGLCGMEITAPGSVKDTSPAQEADAFIRFYVLMDIADSAPIIFEAFSDDDATAPASLFTVATDGINFFFDAGDGSSGPVPAVSGWNMIEMYWAGGTGLEFWVNTDPADPADGSISAVAGTMESVVLGTADAFTGTLTFDDYESHRDTPIGPSDVCNADATGGIDLLDALDVVTEYFTPDLATGSPDCDLNGTVDLLDALDIVDIYFGP